MYGKARKFVKRGAKALRKRYTAKPGGRKATGGVRVAKMAKDILYLKSVLNPEKKRYSTSVIETPVGQVNGNADGAHFSECTPYVSQGITASTRNGASIKLHSSVWHFQMTQQASATNRQKGIIEIWEMPGEPYGGFTWFNEHFTPNPFTGVRDYNCQIDPDNFMKGKCIARRRFQTPADQLNTEKGIVDVKLPIKYNKGQGKHIRYNGDNNTLAFGQMYLVVRMDRGNIGAISTLTVPDVAVNTGITMSWNRIDYYYDN